ncbi:hypothetical protein Pint_03233 [Pistacia integerrima]|uniref:Uncharacterized protein n=1 Tax=Pistacia integerrima TaxID=434235 RepID=A0ACC0ZJ69_9ROSI|nr:hypothetical protein Pint_03233 [Pistacia integerrima]
MPFAAMNNDYGVQLVSAIGKVLEVEVGKNGLGWGSFLRVKVEVELTKPLVRGRILRIGEQKHWIAFKQTEKSNTQFGPWLRASTSKLYSKESKRYGGSTDRSTKNFHSPPMDAAGDTRGTDVNSYQKESEANSQEIIKEGSNSIQTDSATDTLYGKDCLPGQLSKKDAENISSINSPIISANNGSTKDSLPETNALIEDVMAQDWQEAPPHQDVTTTPQLSEISSQAIHPSGSKRPTWKRKARGINHINVEEAAWDNRAEYEELIQREWLCNLNPNSSLPGTMEGLQRGDKKEELQQLKQEIDGLLEEDDIKWKQRAKQQWLKDGDRNTKFFHLCANQRRKSNVIKQISSDDGRFANKPEEVSNLFQLFFQSLFSSSMPERIEDCIRVVKPVITPEMNNDLVKQISNEEVEKDVFNMNGLGSPRSDGFPAIFYQKHWMIIGPSVCATVRDAFCSGSWPQDFNATLIALIPKVKTPSKVSEFRPISLCNILYKILANVLANRPQKILPQIISPSQSAFIPDWLITDNAIVAFEVMHTMNTSLKGKNGYMVLKLDMSKTYDRLEWSFLPAVMLKMVLINGIPKKPFKPSRGIRQGDPLSPYLFIIGAEALSRHIQDAEDRGVIKGVPMGLFKLLDTYEKSSEQRLNKEKTSIFFSKNTRGDIKQQITQMAGVKSSHPYDRYLGLPTLIGRDRTRGFKHILDRVRGKISNWKMKYLSQAGKETLFKAVIQALPTYSMAVQDQWWLIRDLELFNLAILAKQGWRLLHYPNSFAVRVLSAKYYPKGYFLEAKVKRTSSFIWRSVMAARPVLEYGLMWRIGDGSKARIWHDKWLPSPSSFKIQSQCLGMDSEAKVATLIDPQSKSWKLDLLKDLFSESEVNTISNENKKWKKLWKLPITNAEKLFLWKACQDILPTKCNLVKKRIIHHATQELDMLNSLHQSRTSPNAHAQILDPSSPRWQPPPEGIYKINWDASVRKEDRTIGVGITIRDWQGRFMATMRMKKPMFPDAYLADFFAVHQAVILAADIGINQIILEGDALQVVNDLLRDEENWGQASLISMDTKAVSRNFQTFLVHHVNRASNVIAHTLAKDALTIYDVLVELEDVPNCIGSLVDPIE